MSVMSVAVFSAHFVLSLSGSQKLCPDCIYKKRRESPQFRDQAILFDNIALLLVIVPVLCLLYIYLGLLFSGFALALVIIGWRQQRTLVPRSKYRFVLAAGLSLIEAIGWVALVLLADSLVNSKPSYRIRLMTNPAFPEPSSDVRLSRAMADKTAQQAHYRKIASTGLISRLVPGVPSDVYLGDDHLLHAKQIVCCSKNISRRFYFSDIEEPISFSEK